MRCIVPLERKRLSTCYIQYTVQVAKVVYGFAELSYIYVCAYKYVYMHLHTY